MRPAAICCAGNSLSSSSSGAVVRDDQPQHGLARRGGRRATAVVVTPGLLVGLEQRHDQLPAPEALRAQSTSSMRAMGALSPGRGPSFRIRV